MTIVMYCEQPPWPRPNQPQEEGGAQPKRKENDVWRKIEPTNIEEVNRGNVGIFKKMLGVEEILTMQEKNPMQICNQLVHLLFWFLF